MITIVTEGIPPLWGHPWMLPFILFTFSFGACLGSFTNVLIFRIPADMSVVYPPSSCPVCTHRIRWYENIPIISYCFLRGRCSQCSTPISLQYPFIEFILGLWGIALAQQHIWPIFSQPDLWVQEVSVLLVAIATWLWFLIFTGALLAVTIIDLRYTFVPDEISLTLMWLSLAAFFIPMPDPLQHFWGLLVGYGVILSIRWLGYLIYRREAMGLGDAKLLAFIGGFLGWRLIPWILFSAAIQGIIAAMMALAFTKVTGKSNMLTMTSDELDERFGETDLYKHNRIMLVMPFGPFLCLAAFEALMLGPEHIFLWLSLLH